MHFKTHNYIPNSLAGRGREMNERAIKKQENECCSIAESCMMVSLHN